jgi:hypothetical protein
VKIRTGFVSNSSSSSFIVAFPKEPESAKELRQMLFKDKKKIDFSVERASGKYTFSKKKIAKYIFNSLKGLTYNEVDDYDIEDYAKEAMRIDVEDKVVSQLRKSGNVSSESTDEDVIDDIIYDRNPTLRDQYEMLTLKTQMDILFEFVGKNLGSCIHILEYADDSGFPIEGFIEHGDIFENLPHIKISKH